MALHNPGTPRSGPRWRSCCQPQG